MSPSPIRSTNAREPLAAKVPEITAVFWAVKLLTTFTGEAASDFLGEFNVIIGGAVEVLLVAVGLWLQFRARRYFAPAYWFLAAAIATTGTGASDTLHVALAIPYAGTTALWAIVLTVIFWRWHRSEGTLSIHSITSRRREQYYWATVFATFALGTALGDLTATSLNLGYLRSGALFGGVILIPVIAWWRFGMNEVAAFWFAYIVTRPLGATFADLFGRVRSSSGLGYGSGKVAGVGLVMLVALVAYVAVARNDIQSPAGAQPAPGHLPANPAHE